MLAPWVVALRVSSEAAKSLGSAASASVFSVRKAGASLGSALFSDSIWKSIFGCRLKEIQPLRKVAQDREKIERTLKSPFLRTHVPYVLLMLQTLKTPYSNYFTLFLPGVRHRSQSLPWLKNAVTNAQNVLSTVLETAHILPVSQSQGCTYAFTLP